MIRCKKKLNEIIDYAEVVYKDKYAAIEKVKNLLKKLYESHFLENFAQTEDFVPTIHFYITNECNLKCKHCYMDAGKSLEDELSEEEIKLFFGKLNKVIGPTTVVLSGGEPLLKRNFMAISEYIRDLGNRTVLITNGTLIDKKNARKIANLFDIFR
jgi:MoaA/NifB/PqqE/SkfB family radical SAM enzyme